MLNHEMNTNPTGGKTSTQLDEDMDFNALIWAAGLIETGNNEYQNKFYARQYERIHARFYGSGRCN